MSEARDRYYREKIGIDEIMGRLVTDYVEELEKKIEQYEQSSSTNYDVINSGIAKCRFNRAKKQIQNYFLKKMK